MLAIVAIVAFGVAGIRARASEKATTALILRLRQYLDDYRDQTGSYPPDGIDSHVKNEEGTPIYGSACLYYFLAKKPLIKVEMRAGKRFTTELPPIATFQGSELSTVVPEYPGARELVDGWSNPIHYDNTENGDFKAQRGEVHIPPIDDDEHPIDPREGSYEVGTANAVPHQFGVQSAGFDIWSYGEQGHEVKELKAMPIATWNIQE